MSWRARIHRIAWAAAFCALLLSPSSLAQTRSADPLVRKMARGPASVPLGFSPDSGDPCLTEDGSRTMIGELSALDCCDVQQQEVANAFNEDREPDVDGYVIRWLTRMCQYIYDPPPPEPWPATMDFVFLNWVECDVDYNDTCEDHV